MPQFKKGHPVIYIALEEQVEKRGLFNERGQVLNHRGEVEFAYEKSIRSDKEALIQLFIIGLNG